MESSQSIAAIAAALSKAQAKIEGAVKGKDNPAFRSKYADLGAVWDACRDALTANGLSVVQTTRLDGEGTVLVETTLLHSSGEWMRGELPAKPSKADMQGLGSALTYARRYGLMAMVGIAPEDDDANEASNGPGKPFVERKAPPAVANKAKANPFQKSTMDDLDAWFDSNTNADAKSTADATTTAQVAIRAGKLLVDMVENAQDSADDIRERWGHWWTFLEVNSPEIAARFGRKWNDLTGHQEAAE